MASYIINSKKCVLHIDKNNKKSEIHVFKEKSFETCKEVQLLHKRQSNSNYNVIVLPDFADNTSGHHWKCYRNYTVVPNKAKVSAKKVLESAYFTDDNFNDQVLHQIDKPGKTVSLWSIFHTVSI